MADEKVYVVDDLGRVVDIPASSFKLAMQEGYLPATKDQARQARVNAFAQSLPGQIAAGATGVLRGASLGLSDLAITNLGSDEENKRAQEFLNALKEQNKFTDFAGEALGNVATLGSGTIAKGIKTVGAGAENLAGRLVTNGVVKKAAGAAVTGAVEGAATGLSQAISESALQDKDFTAASALAHIASGAKFGALFGGATGIAASGLNAVSGALKSKLPSAQQSLDTFANERALKHAGAIQSDFTKLGNKKWKQLAEDMQSYKLRDGRAVYEAGDDVKDFLEKSLLARQEAGQDLANYRKAVAQFIDKNPDLDPNMGAFFQRLDNDVIDPLRKSYGKRRRKMAQAVADEFEVLRDKYDAGERITISDLESARAQIAEDIYPQGHDYQGLMPQAPAHAKQLVKAERVLADFIEGNTERAARKMQSLPDDVSRLLTDGAGIEAAAATPYAQYKRLSESFIKLNKIAMKASRRQTGNRAISLTDYLTGIAGTAAGGPYGIVTGLAATAVNKVARERGSAVLGVGASKLSSSLPAIVNTTSAGINAAADNILRFGPVVGATYGHARNADSVHDFEARLDEITRVAMDPETTTQRIMAHFGDSDLGVITASMAVTAAQFLQAKAPKDPTERVLQPLVTSWKPSREEVAKWNKYYNAVQDPMGTIERMGKGAVSPEAVEAIKVVYPPLYDRLSQSVIAKAQQLKKPIPYNKRVKLSILLGKPLDDSLKPSSIKFYQQIFQQQPTQQPQRAAGAPAAKLSGAYASRTEKIQERLG